MITHEDFPGPYFLIGRPSSRIEVMITADFEPERYVGLTEMVVGGLTKLLPL